MFRVLWYFNITVVAIATAVFAVSSLFLSTSVKAAPGINEQFNFQGRLLNSAGAAVPDPRRHHGALAGVRARRHLRDGLRRLFTCGL